MTTFQQLSFQHRLQLRATIALQALQAGKDVLVEKPMSLTVSEGERLVETAHRLNRILMVGHVLEYHPAVKKLGELIAEGKPERVRYIYSNRLSMGRIRTEENALWSFAPHDIAIMLRLVGACEAIRLPVMAQPTSIMALPM